MAAGDRSCVVYQEDSRALDGNRDRDHDHGRDCSHLIYCTNLYDRGDHGTAHDSHQSHDEAPRTNPCVQKTRVFASQKTLIADWNDGHAAHVGWRYGHVSCLQRVDDHPVGCSKAIDEAGPESQTWPQVLNEGDKAMTLCQTEADWAVIC